MKEEHQRAQFEQIIQIIAEAIIVLGGDGVIVFANPKAQAYLGRGLGAIVGREFPDGIWEITTIEGRPIPEDERPFMQVKRTGKPIYGVEYAIGRPDESRILVSVNAAPLVGETGEIETVVLALTDITGSKQAAEEVRASRREVLSILGSITDGFFALDNDWRLIYVNQRAEELTGRKRLGALFRNIWDIFPQAVDSRFYRELHRAKEEMVPACFEEFYSESNKWFQIRVYPYGGGLSVYLVDITEGKAREEALKKTEASYRAVFDAANDAIFVHDIKTGAILDINRKVSEMYGYTAEEAKNLNVADLSAGTPPYSQEDAMRWIRKAAEGEPQVFEWLAKNKSGESFWVEVNVKRIVISGEGRLLAIVRDITERKRVEEELRESEERLRAIIDSTTAIIYIKDIEGRYILANREQERLLHMPREEVLGKTDYNFFLREKAGELRANDRKVVQAGMPIEIEEDIPLEDGIHTYVSIKHPLRDSEGRIYGIYGISTDITERKRAEDALQSAYHELERRVEERTAELSETNALLRKEASERRSAEEEREELAGRIQLLLDSTDEGIYGLDLEGKCILFNKAASRMTGHKPEEVLGKNIHELLHHTRRDGSPYPIEECPVYRAVRVGEGVRIDTEVFWREDGTSFPVEYSSYPIIEEGVRKGGVVTFVDITERKTEEEFSDALNNINAAITSTLDFDEIMQRVTVGSAKTVGAESAFINLRENGYWVARHFYRIPQGLVGARFTTEEAKDIVRIAIETKKPVASVDAAHDERVNQEITTMFNIRSLLLAPLIVREKVIGFINFLYHSTAHSFTDTEIDFAAKLAAAASLALENARLYAAERDIADTLQGALLTVPEKVSGIEFGYLYRSATEAAKVGGDFYDVFEIEHNRVGIIIGDVSGKGLEAATLTSLVKNTIRAYAQGDDSPALLMTRTNEVVSKSIPPAMFITVFFGILDTETGHLTYCSGGHPPALIKRGSETVSQLLASSPVIGAFTHLEYTDEEATLEKSDVLILYTDGITEARRDSDFFGDERLMELVGDLPQVPAEEISQAIFNAVMSYSGGRLSDDIALLAVGLESD